MNWGRIAILALTGVLFSGCDSHDSDYIPFLIKGMNVWVYDETDKEYYGGHVNASYFSKDKAINGCQVQARSFARQNHLKDWSYICCIVTPSSDCATKVI